MRAKTPVAKYFPSKKGADLDIKPKKTKDPAPGSYNIEDAFRRTQLPKSNYSISKGKYKSYIGKLISLLTSIDIAVKDKSYIPGIGKYKDTEKGYQSLSKPPTSLRRYR